MFGEDITLININLIHPPPPFFSKSLSSWPDKWVSGCSGSLCSGVCMSVCLHVYAHTHPGVCVSQWWPMFLHIPAKTAAHPPRLLCKRASSRSSTSFKLSGWGQGDSDKTNLSVIWKQRMWRAMKCSQNSSTSGTAVGNAADLSVIDTSSSGLLVIVPAALGQDIFQA